MLDAAMTVISVAFWLSVGCIAYTYAMYPILLFLMSTWHQLRSDWRYVSGGVSRRGTSAPARTLPSVAILIAAHNEERHIAERIRNVLGSDYPTELLRLYIGSDASSDGTAAIVNSVADDRLVFRSFEQRRGKPSIINDLAALATEDILVLTDANTLFSKQTIAHLARHFCDPAIGCVNGELRLMAPTGTENQDHIYWRYERMLKFFENRIDGLLGANGGVYALRREHYRAIPSNTIVDDFWISMELVRAGYRCVYCPEAVAFEEVPARIGDEFRRRVRIGVGNYQALRHFAGMLNPRTGVVAFTFFSHKVVRWFVPHCMVLALLCNVVLADRSPYDWILGAQVAFYAAALLGWSLGRNRATPRLLRIPVFFVGMNMALGLGFWRYCTGTFSGAWARSAR